MISKELHDASTIDLPVFLTENHEDDDPIIAKMTGTIASLLAESDEAKW